jgi:hypothetical protein
MLQHAQLLVLRLLQVLQCVLQLLDLRLLLHHFLIDGMRRGRTEKNKNEKRRKRSHNLSHKHHPR